MIGQAACFALLAALLGATALGGGDAPGVAWLVALTLAGTALCSAALPLLVRHAQENAALGEGERRRWLVRLALWGPVTMPVYWRRYARG